MISDMNHEEHLLEALRLGLRTSLPAGLVIDDVQGSMDYMRDSIVLELSAHVMGTRPESVSTRDYIGIEVGMRVRPWWIPKFMWNRIKCEARQFGNTVKFTVDGRLVFPDNTVRWPNELGGPVRLLTKPRTSIQDWRKV